MVLSAQTHALRLLRAARLRGVRAGVRRRRAAAPVDAPSLLTARSSTQDCRHLCHKSERGRNVSLPVAVLRCVHACEHSVSCAVEGRWMGMSADAADRPVQLLVVVVAVECGRGAGRRGRTGAWQVFTGDGRPVDYLAAAGSGVGVVLALSALLVSRTVRELDLRVPPRTPTWPRPRPAAAAVGHRPPHRAGCWPTRRTCGSRCSRSWTSRPARGWRSRRWPASPTTGAPDQWFAEAHEVGHRGRRWSGSRCERALVALPSCRRA